MVKKSLRVPLRIGKDPALPLSLVPDLPASLDQYHLVRPNPTSRCPASNRKMWRASACVKACKPPKSLFTLAESELRGMGGFEQKEYHVNR